jgi:hypothetical protein
MPYNVQCIVEILRLEQMEPSKDLFQIDEWSVGDRTFITLFPHPGGYRRRLKRLARKCRSAGDQLGDERVMFRPARANSSGIAVSSQSCLSWIIDRYFLHISLLCPEDEQFSHESTHAYRRTYGGIQYFSSVPASQRARIGFVTARVRVANGELV